MNCNTSMVVLDPKGEIARDVGNLLKARGMEVNVLGEATIIKRLGANAYLANYNGVKCTAMFNPFARRYFVDDKYGVIHEHERPDSGEP